MKKKKKNKKKMKKKKMKKKKMKKKKEKKNSLIHPKNSHQINLIPQTLYKKNNQFQHPLKINNNTKNHYQNLKLSKKNLSKIKQDSI